MPAVAVADLRKSYGSFEALRGIDFEIEAGEVFGLLGPNGAGKTTTVEILEGYRARDAGTVSVLGEDPERAGAEWRERIGVVLQSSAMYQNLSVAESLALFGGYYECPLEVDRVIDVIGLTEKRDARVRTLSGGQQRRLDLGLGLIGDPEILFLDEPTTGFDPAARRAAWEVIRSLRSLGKTILLTTHYLDEAEQLSDRVAVLRDGHIAAIGRPADLTGAAPKTEIRYRLDGEEVLISTDEPTRVLHELTTHYLDEAEQLSDRVAVLREGRIAAIGRPAELAGAAPKTEIRYRRDGEEVLVSTDEPTRVLHELTAQAVAEGQELEDLSVRRPTLEEIYLALTTEEER